MIIKLNELVIMEIKNSLEKVETLLLQCESDLEIVKEFISKLPHIQNNIKKLQKYYQNEYSQDLGNKNNINKYFRILDEDSIWNVLSDYDNYAKNILKLIVKNL